MSELRELAERLGEFERRYNNLLRNDAKLSPEGQGIAIALLTTINMSAIAEAAAALRAREEDRG